MSSKRRKLVVIISIISVFSILFGTVVAAAAWSEGGISELWNSLTNKDGVVKYEKPSVGEIAQDGAYPDEVKSNSSANAQEKEWYEYITYSKTPIEEVKDGNKKLVFYDPYDYNYGMIMKIFDTPRTNGIYENGGYTTSNVISTSYTTSKSFSWARSSGLDIGFEEEIGAEAFCADVSLKFTQHISSSVEISFGGDSEKSVEVTYNAIYFNKDGTPYNWRIVGYAVYLPLYCEAQTLIDGQWVVTNTDYCLLATVQGTCREWINEVAYVEDWRTGEAVPVEDFWEKFFSTEALVKAYVNQMIPKN